MTLLWPILLIFSLILFWCFTLIGLPGNWLMLIACALYTYFYSLNATAMMGWGTVITIAVVVLIAEIIEFAAGAAGVTKGGSRRGAVLAVVGSIVGSLLGASFGSVIPIAGTVIGILLGASAGAMVGAIIGERTLGKDADFQWEIGKTAFWGRFWGSLGKILIGAIVIGIATASVVL